MIKVFNSRFENSLRMILLLYSYSVAKDLDCLYITDFLTVYGKDFEITSENLNGDNDYKYSELQSRKLACRQALRELVLNGLVIPVNDQDGILYGITDAGKEYAEDLRSEYAIEYKSNAEKAIQYVDKYTSRQVLRMLNRLSTESLRGEIGE